MKKNYLWKILVGMLMFGLVFALSGCPVGDGGGDEGSWPGTQPGSGGRPQGGGGFEIDLTNFTGSWLDNDYGDTLVVSSSPNTWTFFAESAGGTFTVVSATRLNLVGLWGATPITGTATLSNNNNTLTVVVTIPAYGTETVVFTRP